jgi:hypothetical protein
MLERELAIIRWLFLGVWIAILILAIAVAASPSYLVSVAHSFFPSLAEQTNAAAPLLEPYAALAMSYFCVILILGFRVWRDPENYLGDLSLIVRLLCFPPLFLLRHLLTTPDSPSVLIFLFFLSLAMIVWGFRKRLQSIAAQKQVFRPLK